MTTDRNDPKTHDLLDALVVGAGFSGLYMLHRLREAGFRARVFEAGSGVGGTWYWNRYPGARCDIESMEYSYQFSEELQQEWQWPERYSAQADILAYLNHVADRFDLRQDIQLDTRVHQASFDEESGLWIIETEQGERVRARFFITGVGCLSAANTPQWKGLESFAGETCHTSNWPADGVDFAGKRVGVVGTGSSAVQSIPIIAEQAEHLYVFQRTPTYSVPARNTVLDPDEERAIKARYREFRQEASETPFGIHGGDDSAPSAKAETPDELEQQLEQFWNAGGLYFQLAYEDTMLDDASNHLVAEFVRNKIRESIADPKLADALVPDQALGCKRLCADSNYYETFNRSNVTLVDVSQAPIERVTEAGIVADGHEYGLDYIVLATGFDAMTGSLLGIDIRGVNGLELRKKWQAGPLNYLGLGISQFPNFFNLAGPGSPSVLSNMVPSIEQHVNWVIDCLEYMRAGGLVRIEAAPEAEEEWVAHVNAVSKETLYPGCSSWYLGANIEGKPRVFMPYIGFSTYVEKCNEVAERGYEGFTLQAGT